MVKVCRTPAISRHIFTANELSGHPDGITYTAKELKRRKKYRAQNNLHRPVHEEPAVKLDIGKQVNR